MKVWLAFAVLVLAPAAHADTPPSFWEDAKHPGATERYERHVAASAALIKAEITQHLPTRLAPLEAEVWLHEHRRAMESAQALLADPGNDIALRYDRAWLAKLEQDFPKCVRLLEPLAKELGNAPLSWEVWHELAECYVRTERTADEIRAYDEVLARATDDEHRIVPLLNQGEALMRIGQVDTAIEQFGEVARLSATVPYGNEQGMLAQWDLAVAMDRGGNPLGALRAVRSALSMTTLMKGLFPVSRYNTSVYFVPEYERDWYLALGHAALAADAATPSEAMTEWDEAVAQMVDYIASAKPDDRWTDLAKKRLLTYRARRAEAQQRAH